MNALLVLLISSTVALVATLLLPAIDLLALIFSIVSIALCAIVKLLKAKNPDALAKVLCNLPKVNKGVSVDLLLATILFCVWGVGAGIFTFQRPFVTTSNGYFACWGALISSGKHMQVCWVAVKSESPSPAPLKRQLSMVKVAAKNVKAQIGALLVCYAVVLAASLQYVEQTVTVSGSAGGYSYSASAKIPMPWEATLALAVSSTLIVFGLILVLLIDKLPDLVVKVLAFTMFGLGFLEAFICTFRAPFVETGNGFFGSWLGLVCAVAVSVPMLPDCLKSFIAVETVASAKVMPTS